MRMRCSYGESKGLVGVRLGMEAQENRALGLGGSTPNPEIGENFIYYYQGSLHCPRYQESFHTRNEEQGRRIRPQTQGKLALSIFARKGRKRECILWTIILRFTVDFGIGQRQEWQEGEREGDRLIIIQQDEMNLFGKLQSEYEQLWKYIIRPSRTPYSEDNLGPTKFRLEGQDVIRRDFELTNSRGYTFSGSIWLPTLFDKYNCVVYLHGNSGNRTQGMQYLGKFIKNNLALCTFDFSGCGNADGEYVTLGYYEQEDLKLVIEQIKTMECVNYLAIWGRSMGAVTTMLYLSKTIDIKGVVFDSPFKSLKCLVEDMAKRNSKVPSFVLAGAIKIISKTVEDKANFSIYNINPLKYSVPGLYCPAFFIVAIEDDIVPCEHTKELFAAYAGQDKQLKLVKGRHNDSRPQECVNDAVTFLLDKFGHDWKESLKKTKKEFDFFEMERELVKQQEKEVEEHKNDHVDFFAEQGQDKQEVQQVEENIKKGEFSLSSLFSIFSWDKKKDKEKEREKEKEKAQPVKDGYEQTRNILMKKSMNEPTRQRLEQKNAKRDFQEKMRQQCGKEDNSDQLSQWIMYKL